jgi:hypothetical protein
MSPTVSRYKSFRFLFFAREERRMHVHALSGKGEAKFWLEPSVEMAMSRGIPTKDLTVIEEQIKERTDEIRDAWKKHFES